MNFVVLGPCDYVFDIDDLGADEAVNGQLSRATEDCIRGVFRAIRTNGHGVLLEYIQDGVAVFEECGVFFHIKREPNLIAILRIVAI